MIQLETKINIGPNLRRFLRDGSMFMMQVQDSTDGDATVALTAVNGIEEGVLKEIFGKASLFLEVGTSRESQAPQAPHVALPYVESEFQQLRERIPDGNVSGQPVQNLYAGQQRSPQQQPADGETTTLSGASVDQQGPEQQYKQASTQPQQAPPQQWQQGPPQQWQQGPPQQWQQPPPQQWQQPPPQHRQQPPPQQWKQPPPQQWQQGPPQQWQQGPPQQWQQGQQGPPLPPQGSQQQYRPQQQAPPPPVPCIMSGKELLQELANLGDIPDISMDHQLNRQEVAILDKVKLSKAAYVVSTVGNIIVDDINITVDSNYPSNLASVYPGRLVRSNDLRRCFQNGWLKFISAEEAAHVSQSVDNVDMSQGMPAVQGRAQAYRMPYMVGAMGTVVPDQELMGAAQANPADYGIVMAGQEGWELANGGPNMQDIDYNEQFTSDQAKLFSIAGQDPSNFQEGMQVVQSTGGINGGFVSQTQRPVGRLN